MEDTIGSVNLAEFFVTFSESVAFLLTVRLGYWRVILGLLIGGVIAAPMAAIVTRQLPVRKFNVLVGVLIIALSIRTIQLTL